MNRTKTPKVNGHERNAAAASQLVRNVVLPPSERTGVSAPPSNPGFVELKNKRNLVARVRIASIDAVWTDKGSLDGPFFVQAGGRTFHPCEESFAAVQSALCLLHTA